MTFPSPHNFYTPSDQMNAYTLVFKEGFFFFDQILGILLHL